MSNYKDEQSGCSLSFYLISFCIFGNEISKKMNAIDLRHELISRIAGIEDVNFLNAIKTILDYKKNEPFIELSSDLESELLKASEEVKKGEFISQSKMDKKVEAWLTEK